MVVSLATASAKVAFFLSFFLGSLDESVPVPLDSLDEGVPVPFLRRRPFIDSRFADLPPPYPSGEDASSSDRVFLLLRECSSSEPLGEDFLEDFLVEPALFPL